MKKIIFTLLILLIFVNTGMCAENFTTNIITETSPNIVGGTDVIIPHHHYYDSWFSVRNEGHISYQVYQYNYIGNHTPYTDSFIAVLNPNQIVMLNNNASYRFYASYDTIQDFTDIEKIKDKFNMWWIYIFIGIILFSIVILGIKKVLRI